MNTTHHCVLLSLIYSVQTQAILTSLQEQGIEYVYIETDRLYTDSSVTVHLHKESETITIKRGVRQGNTISPKMFTATLESIFRRLNYIAKLMVVDNTHINVNNVLIENFQGSGTWHNTTASMKRTSTKRKRTRAKRYKEESWQAGRHTPNTGISSKATLLSA